MLKERKVIHALAFCLQSNALLSAVEIHSLSIWLHPSMFNFFFSLFLDTRVRLPYKSRFDYVFFTLAIHILPSYYGFFFQVKSSCFVK